ncbi:MAG: response regulator [Vulcanimicrobiaceae bacterium]
MGARILVVEDNRTNLDLMLYLLGAFGHSPEGVTDGLAGLESARSGSYDLVLSDVLMPGIDGYEFAKRFRGDPQLKSRKLVAVTALAMVGDRERLMAAGYDGYIPKPIDPRMFVTQVETYLNEELRSTVRREQPQPAERAAESAPTGPVILAVDDIQVNLDVIRGALQPFGYRIIEARSVREASEKILRFKPALILCDLHMRDGSGFEFITRVKAEEELRDIPFVFLSSTSWRNSERKQGLELGAVAFLTRPIDPRRLLDEVQRCLGEARHVEDSHR